MLTHHITAQCSTFFFLSFKSHPRFWWLYVGFSLSCGCCYFAVLFIANSVLICLSHYNSVVFCSFYVLYRILIRKAKCPKKLWNISRTKKHTMFVHYQENTVFVVRLPIAIKIVKLSIQQCPNITNYILYVYRKTRIAYCFKIIRVYIIVTRKYIEYCVCACLYVVCVFNAQNECNWMKWAHAKNWLWSSYQYAIWSSSTSFERMIFACPHNPDGYTGLFYSIYTLVTINM